jgi:hypothetical protein
MTYIFTKSIFPEDEERIKKDLTLKSEKFKYPFRLFDADDKLYFEGLSAKKYSFDPLDDEMDNSGCTDIKYFINGTWELL